MTAPVEEDSMALIANNKVPKLKCLQLNNSTVYRWNRPCYGISDTGKPHLRIENRVFPSGPTVLDEMANTAFWLGAMKGLGQNYDDITKHMSFEDVRDNFGKAARFGIDTKFTWMKDKKVSVEDLVLKELLPLAKEGLAHMKVNPEHITRYMDVIEGRMEKHMNGARWALRSYTKLVKDTSSTDEALTNLTASMYANQCKEDHPVHMWEESDIGDLKNYHPTEMRVSQVMQTELITAHRSDLLEMVANLMKWRNFGYMPIEDKNGNLEGLICLNNLVGNLVDEKSTGKQKDLLVEDVMIKTPYTVSPDDNIKTAIGLMREKTIGCLPVVSGTELVGIVTDQDIIRVTDRMMK